MLNLSTIIEVIRRWAKFLLIVENLFRFYQKNPVLQQHFIEIQGYFLSYISVHRICEAVLSFFLPGLACCLMEVCVCVCVSVLSTGARVRVCRGRPRCQARLHPHGEGSSALWCLFAAVVHLLVSPAWAPCAGGGSQRSLHQVVIGVSGFHWGPFLLS